MRLPDFLGDVQVECAALPASLAEATARGVLWQALPGRFLLEVPEVARYDVRDGQRITLQPEPGVANLVVERFLKLTPLAALGFQRGVLAFHAAAAAHPSGTGAVLLAGDSGAGKSTLLAALLQRKWRLLADELAWVEMDQHGEPCVFPTSPEIALWPQAMLKLGLWDKETAHIDTERPRQYLDYSSCLASHSTRVKSMYHLTSHHSVEVRHSRLEGAPGFQAVGLLLYNSHIAEALLDRRLFFQQVAAIVGSVALHRLERPEGRWSAEELADRVESEGW